MAATPSLVASPGRTNGPRHVGIVVDPLVADGPVGSEVRPSLDEPQVVSEGRSEVTETNEDSLTSSDLAGSGEPPETADAMEAMDSELSGPPVASRPAESEDGGPGGDLPLAGLRRGGQEVRERLLARARVAQGRGRPEAGGLSELDPEPSRPIDEALDLVGTPLSRAPVSPAPPSRTGLSPMMVAIVGTLLGLATVASIIALAIHVDPQDALPQLVRPTADRPAEEAVDAPREPVAAPAPVAKKRHRKKVPGPWRVLDDKDKPGMRVVKGTIGRDAFLRVVQGKGIKKGQAYRLLKAFEGVVDLDKPRRSDRFIALVERGSGKIRGFEYVRAKEEVYQAKENDQGYLRGKRLDLKIEHEQYRGGFIMTGSLDDSAKVAGFEPGLRGVLTKALHGHMDPDFDKGDRLRVVAQEITVLGEFSRYAGIEALEFVSANGKTKKRIYYFKGSKERGYYDAKGRSPYEGGWRNPIPGAPITSPFGMRMHPVLKTRKMHAGTDFGAPTGTPIYASSFGTITFRGYAGAAGNVVKIEHPGGIETSYFHLSRFESGQKVGDKVKRMQVIGYCGSTGRSTGPHLHFAAKKNGKYFDPMTLKLDALRVVHQSERGAFKEAKAAYDKMLDAIPLPEPLPPVAPAVEPQFVASHDGASDSDNEVVATGGADAAPASSPAPAEPAKRPNRPGSVIYLTDKELLKMQSSSDDGEVEY